MQRLKEGGQRLALWSPSAGDEQPDTSHGRRAAAGEARRLFTRMVATQADHPCQSNSCMKPTKSSRCRAVYTVDATIISAPSSKKNEKGERDPEMRQVGKGKQYFFGMKAHIGVDADCSLVHTVTTTAANEADVEQVADLLHGKEEQVWADSGYRGAQSRARRELPWQLRRARATSPSCPMVAQRRRRARTSTPRRVCERRSSIRSV